MRSTMWSAALRTVRSRLRSIEAVSRPVRHAALLGAAMCAFTGCGGDGGSGPSAASIRLSPSTPTITVGESVTLVATPVDANGNVVSVGSPISWSTSAAAIATVDNAGKVTAVSAGTADITASAGRVTGTTRVTVLRLPVARVEIAPTSVTFGRSETRQLAASVFAADDSPLTDRTITWTTSTTAVVTLSATTGQTVTLTAVAPGTATVSAASEGITRDVTVTVQPDPVITFTPQSASLGATEGGANPAALTITVSNTGGGTLAGLAAGAVSYSAGQPSGWLTAGFENGTSAPAALTLRATTGALTVGAYTATVPVSSTSPGAQARNLAVTFNVGSANVLGATPTSVSFTAPGGSGNPTPQTVNVFSVNGTAIANLAVGTIAYGNGQPSGWLTASLSGSNAPASLTLTPTVGSLPSGTYTASVPITAPTATNSPLVVAVTFVVPAPLIALSAVQRIFTATQSIGTTSAQLVTITNGGRGTLSGLQVSVSYAGGPTGWLSASLNTTAAPATLTLTPLANNISRGTYSATVQVSAPGVANSPQNVSVSYTLVYTFDTHVGSALASNTCSSASCHAVQPPVMAASSGDVYARLVNNYYVTPQNLAASVLYQRVNAGTMPPGGVVNTALRDAIQAWILDGARRN